MLRSYFTYYFLENIRYIDNNITNISLPITISSNGLLSYANFSDTSETQSQDLYSSLKSLNSTLDLLLTSQKLANETQDFVLNNFFKDTFNSKNGYGSLNGTSVLLNDNDLTADMFDFYAYSIAPTIQDWFPNFRSFEWEVDVLRLLLDNVLSSYVLAADLIPVFRQDTHLAFWFFGVSHWKYSHRGLEYEDGSSVALAVDLSISTLFRVVACAVVLNGILECCTIELERNCIKPGFGNQKG